MQTHTAKWPPQWWCHQVAPCLLDASRASVIASDSVRRTLGHLSWKTSRRLQRIGAYAAWTLLAMAALLSLGGAARAEERSETSKSSAAPKTTAAALVHKETAPASDKRELVSLETEGRVATKSFRRELDPEAAAKAAKVKRIERTASGVVVARGTNGMAFSAGFAGGGREFWLPFEAGLKLMGYRSLSEIHDGDHVNVTYEEKEDDHELFLKRVALMQQAPPAGGSTPADAAPTMPAASSSEVAP